MRGKIAMAMTEPTASSAAGSAPVDAVMERLNDPGVAASLVTLLDNSELLSTLVLGLSGLVERGDMIMDAVAEGVGDMKAAAGQNGSSELPSISELGAVAGQLSTAAPLLTNVLDSSIASPESIAVLSNLADAAAEGQRNAVANNTKVDGVRGAMKTLKDPEVQQGLGVLVEIARALGRQHPA